MLKTIMKVDITVKAAHPPKNFLNQSFLSIGFSVLIASASLNLYVYFIVYPIFDC